jgi:hypothetical protein
LASSTIRIFASTTISLRLPDRGHAFFRSIRLLFRLAKADNDLPILLSKASVALKE